MHRDTAQLGKTAQLTGENCGEQMQPGRYEFLAPNAAAEFQMIVDPGDFFRRPGGDLVEMEDTVLVELLFVHRADALDAGEVVGAAAARGGEAVGDAGAGRSPGGGLAARAG